jgi:hypothetical protein
LTSICRHNRLVFDPRQRHPIRPIGADRLPLAGVDEPTKVANVPRCDDHLEAVFGDKQRLRRDEHVTDHVAARNTVFCFCLHALESSFAS